MLCKEEESTEASEHESTQKKFKIYCFLSPFIALYLLGMVVQVKQQNQQQRQR